MPRRGSRTHPVSRIFLLHLCHEEEGDEDDTDSEEESEEDGGDDVWLYDKNNAGCRPLGFYAKVCVRCVILFYMQGANDGIRTHATVTSQTVLSGPP